MDTPSGPIPLVTSRAVKMFVVYAFGKTSMRHLLTTVPSRWTIGRPQDRSSAGMNIVRPYHGVASKSHK
jgi:hypothetical protein